MVRTFEGSEVFSAFKCFKNLLRTNEQTRQTRQQTRRTAIPPDGGNEQPVTNDHPGSDAVSHSVQLLETELSLSLVLDYGTGVWNTDIVATITMMIIDFATKATYIRLLHGKIGFMGFFSALAP